MSAPAPMSSTRCADVLPFPWHQPSAEHAVATCIGGELKNCKEAPVRANEVSEQADRASPIIVTLGFEGLCTVEAALPLTKGAVELEGAQPRPAKSSSAEHAPLCGDCDPPLKSFHGSLRALP